MSGFEVVIRRKVFPGASGPLTVLEDLRFRVRAGEFVCVLGPSGCGKSTLLNILAGLDAGYDGDIRFDGSSRPRQGVVFQSPRLMPWLSLRDNIELIADHASRSAGRPASLLRDVGLGGFADTTPGRLSGGMQRRAALARALVNDNALLLLDEPFASLDAPSASDLRGWLLEEWRRGGQTILCLTHDLREAMVLADRLLFLSPRPARVILDEPVALPRPRCIDDPTISAFRDELLRTRPELLSGSPVVANAAN